MTGPDSQNIHLFGSNTITITLDPSDWTDLLQCRTHATLLNSIYNRIKTQKLNSKQMNWLWIKTNFGFNLCNLFHFFFFISLSCILIHSLSFNIHNKVNVKVKYFVSKCANISIPNKNKILKFYSMPKKGIIYKSRNKKGDNWGILSFIHFNFFLLLLLLFCKIIFSNTIFEFFLFIIIFFMIWSIFRSFTFCSVVYMHFMCV